MPKKRRFADAVVAHPPKLLVAHLRQNRIHHQQQTERDRQRDRPDPQPVEPVVQARDQRAEPSPAAIASPIQSGRKRSSVESLPRTAASS